MAARNGQPDAVLGDLYPFEDKWVELADGTTMHFVEMGSSGFRKPTLLLLHGNPTWSFLYRDLIGPLSKVARVVVPDHVGFGRSDHPSDPSYYTLERHISNLEEFVAKLGLKRVVPVLHDWGGPIGAGYATRHPENVAGLVVLNTWAFTEKVPIKLNWLYKSLRTPVIGNWALGRRNLFVETFIPKLLMAPPSAGVMEAYRHPFPTVESRAGMAHTPAMIPDKPQHPEWATMDAIEKALPRLTAPAIILWGAKDPALGKRFAWGWKESLPNCAEPRFFDHAGHWLQEDIPQTLANDIRAFVETL